MRKLNEECKVLSLVPPQAQIATVTGSAVDVEKYEDDALAIANLGAFTSDPTITITIVGSLVATPSTYNQTLATFTAATATGIGAMAVNLAGIKNVKGVSTLAGGTSPSVPVAITLVATPTVSATSTNSATLA